MNTLSRFSFVAAEPGARRLAALVFGLFVMTAPLAETASTPHQMAERTSAASRNSESARGPRTCVPGVPPKTSPIAEAAQSRYFTASDGARLHYLEAGRGQTLVFVPGWTMPAYVWQAQIDRFARHYRVIAFDPRGQGRSSIPANGYTPERRALDIKELLDQLGDQPVVLAGWSLGVLEALAYVRQHGDAQVAALVLVDNSIGEEPPPVFDPTFLPRLRRDQKATMRRFVRGMHRTTQSEQYLNRLTRSALRVPLEASLALLNYNHPRQYWKETVYATRKPLLYVVSNRFRGQALNLEKNRPGSRIAVFENAGHALFVDEPKRFNLVLGDFLTREVWPR